MIKKLNAWRLAKYRALEWGPEPHKPYHITFTPRLGISFPWFGGRVRWAMHHGLQFVRWNGKRWYVAKQILGTSSVRGEVFKEN